MSSLWGSLVSEGLDPPMVKEAFTLLRQSIIHIEQDDVAFEEEEVEQEADELGEAERAATADPGSPTRAGGSGAQLMDSPIRRLRRRRRRSRTTSIWRCNR
jgi:hypothetical protein